LAPLATWRFKIYLLPIKSTDCLGWLYGGVALQRVDVYCDWRCDGGSRLLGPGFLEAVYQKALAHELRARNIPFQEQVPLPVVYKGELVGEYVADFVIDGKLIKDYPRHP
jgi:hypothetical protein